MYLQDWGSFILRQARRKNKMGKKLTIELPDFDAVTFSIIMRQVKDIVTGQTPEWTKEYRKVLAKVSSQVDEQMGFEKGE
jgi:hypothetical protein